MAVIVEEAGLATSVQDGGRRSVAHLGVPPGGAADPLSLAMANWLVGKPAGAAALEFTIMGGKLRFETRTCLAVAGGAADVTLNGEPVDMYTQCTVNPDDLLEISPLKTGCRLYLALCTQIQGEEVFGSLSTYAPGGFGGLHGRMLADGDVIPTIDRPDPPTRSVPEKYRPFIDTGWVLRAVTGPEIDQLDEASRETLFTQAFRASQRASRQGVELDQPVLSITSGGAMQSAAVFPGTVQCPPSGKPYLLLADAQTTGGYPRLAQVIRADRHQMGQIRPGDTVRFMETDPEEAAEILREKTSLYAELFGEDIF